MSSSELGSDFREDQWALVGRRLTRPCRQWTFYVVLILGIIVLGYLAVWIEAKKLYFSLPKEGQASPDLDSLKLSYATAILAVGAPCLMQLTLTLNKMALIVGFILFFFVCSSAYSVSTGDLNLVLTHLCGIFGLIVATLSWWLANGEDELFQDRGNANAASGGDTNRPLSGGPSGVSV